MTVEDTLPALAAAISEWFPELEGRSLPVLDTDITPETMPTLPISMQALIREGIGKNNTARTPHIIEEIVVDFWFKPARYKNPEDQTDTPFWGYYSYTKLRNKLLLHTKQWQSPICGRLSYRGMEIDVNQFAAMFTFRFTHEFYLNEELEPEFPDGQPVLLTSSICAPASLYCPEDATPEEEDPCQ